MIYAKLVELRVVDWDDTGLEGHIYPNDVAGCTIKDRRYPVYYLNELEKLHPIKLRTWFNVWFYKYGMSMIVLYMCSDEQVANEINYDRRCLH